MNYEKTGTITLLVATLLVAISILLDGTPSKLFNGAAGLTWFTSAGLLSVAASRTRPSTWQLWTGVVLLTGLVAFLIKPTDFLPAAAGFGFAGFVVAWQAGDHRMLWAKLVVGLYLPFHIGTAIAKAIGRSLAGNEASIRTEPPPTAAMIPLVMLLAALAGAFVAGRIAELRAGQRTQMAHDHR